MIAEDHSSTERKTNAQIQKPQIAVPCPRWLCRRMFRSLQHAAYYDIFPDRAHKARQILEQIEAEQAAAKRRRHIEQPTAVALPSPSPTAVEPPAPPDRVRRRWPARATVKRCLHKAAKWVTRIYSRIHGRSIAGQPGPGRRSKRLVTH